MIHVTDAKPVHHFAISERPAALGVYGQDLSSALALVQGVESRDAIVVDGHAHTCAS